MSQPSEQPEWASGGSAKLADPTAGKKAIGWVRKEKPASEILNWWQNLVYLWILWLSGFFDSSGDLILPSDAYAKVQGTGVYKRPARVRKIHAGSGMMPVNGGNTQYGQFGTGSGDGNNNSLDDVWQVPAGAKNDATHFGAWYTTVPEFESERMTVVSARVFGDTTGTFTLRVYKMIDGASTLIGTPVASATTASWQTITISGLTETFNSDATTYYIVQVSITVGTTFTAAGKLSGVQITTDVP